MLGKDRYILASHLCSLAAPIYVGHGLYKLYILVQPVSDFKSVSSLLSANRHKSLIHVGSGDNCLGHVSGFDGNGHKKLTNLLVEEHNKNI